MAIFALSFFLSLEIATRIDQAFHYGAPLFGAYSYDSALFEYDEHGIRGRPGGVYEKWRLNALGLRGPEASLRPEGDRLRIVALGASETFGLYESPNSEWPRVLEQELSRQGVYSEVLNGAIAGMSSAAQLRHLRHRLLPLSPDVVIWIVHYASFAGFDPAHLEALSDARISPRDPPGLVARLTPRTFRRLRDAIPPRLPEPVHERIESGWMRLKLTRARLRSGEAFGSMVRVSNNERATFEYFLARVKQETEETGASLIVVLPPRRLDEPSLRTQYLAFPSVASSWLVDALEIFSRSAADASTGGALSVVDLHQLFGSDVNEFMMDTVHFNDAGALAFAKAIAPSVVTASFSDRASAR